MNELTLEERRRERLRNLLTPLVNLPSFVTSNVDGKYDEIITSTAKKSEQLVPMIKEALRSDITLDELNQLYSDVENRENPTDPEWITKDAKKYGDIIRMFVEHFNDNEQLIPLEIQKSLAQISKPKIEENYDDQPRKGSVDYMVMEEMLKEIREQLDYYEKLNPVWIDYSWDDKSTHPTEYGKYFVCRKDGKIHWETWNNSSWAYNHKEIVGWIDIPSIEKLLKNQTKNG